MRRTLLAVASFSPLLLLPVACSVEPSPDAPEERVAERDDSIIGGTADTTHKAVMWLYDEDQGGSCSGTVIAKNGGTAWVLTAGHCEGIDFVIQANNYETCFNNNDPNCEAVYQVTADQAHPSWNGDAGNGYDFRILTISGAANAPVIPAAQNPDGLSPGSPIEAVGYGITPNNNSIRRHVTETVDQLYGTPPLIMADQTDGTGSCSGDSGGPVLFNGNVVGVTSFGDQNCTQYGAYGRVQAVYSTWIAGIIGGVVMPNCDDCFNSATQPNGACGSQYTACGNNQDCVDFATCINACTTDSCIQGCVNAHPTGYDLYVAIIDCGCSACASECANECGGSSSSSTGSGPGPTSTGATTGSGAGGDGVGGAGDGGAGDGGSTSSGGKKKKKKSTDDADEDTTSSSCAVATVGSQRSDGYGLLGLGGIGLLAGILRRRRRA
ncbi:MAG: trypsin-like serine protease [Myxococcales bacterium]|nr:trypsin-like serine protease [Myxococcales bacterium]